MKHVDNDPRTPDTRAVTAILYLNGDWKPSDGGCLRVYSAHPEALTAGTHAGAAADAAVAGLKAGAPGISGGSQYVDVEPRRGTMVLFWSHRIEHEVLPANTPRFALSLWMCVAPEQHPGWLL